MSIKKCAWVFCIWGHEKYIVGACAGAGTLRLINTCHDIVLLYATFPESKINEILIESEKSDLFDLVQKVDLIEIPAKELKTKKQRELYGGYFSRTCFTKWSCLALEQYSKVMFVDADMICSRNCDFLFSLRAPAATFSNPFVKPYADFDKGGGIPNPYGVLKHNDKITPLMIKNGLEDGFQCGGSLCLFEPSLLIWEEYKTWLNKIIKQNGAYGHSGSYSSVDEQSICEFLSIVKNKSWTHIDPIYQVIPWKNNWFPFDPYHKDIKKILQKAYWLHFYHVKVYEKGEKGENEYSDTNIWWELYHKVEQKYPNLAKSLKPLCSYYRPIGKFATGS